MGCDEKLAVTVRRRIAPKAFDAFDTPPCTLHRVLKLLVDSVSTRDLLAIDAL
jgi:hypothetical protein